MFAAVARFFNPALGRHIRVEHEDNAIVAEWKEPYRKGVVYYLADGRVRGVLAWGVFGKMDAARALIAEAGPHDERTLLGRIQA